MAYRGLSLVVAGTLLAAVAAPAAAQNSGLDRRMDRLEQTVRTLQSIVLQAQATGQPVVVRPEGPDPLLTSQQQRITDLEQTIQRLNGQVDTLTFELEQSRRNTTAAETDQRTALQTMNERLARIESQIGAITAVLGPVEPLAAGPNDTRTAPDDPTGRAQAADTGSLNAQMGAPPPPPPPPPPPANAAEAFTRARDLFNAGDHEAAGRAFEDFVARYGSNRQAPEAYYWLGESYFLRRGYQTATAAYANALKSRPTTSWAPAAMARLAQSLAYSNQTAQACAALGEFDQRYASRASTAVKAYAQTARTRAKCG